MSLRDEAAEQAAADEVAAVKHQLALERAEHARTRHELGHVRELADRYEKVAGVADRLSVGRPRVPRWLRPKGAKDKSHRATLCLLLSDMHFDEVVNPDEVDGLNAYDRTIATQRLRRFGERTVMVARNHLSGVKYDGVVLMLGGDGLSGDIHDELRQTNADTTLGSILYWQEQLSALVGMLVDEFGHVHVPAVVGNHGRMTRKPRAKLRARDNTDWFLAHQVARSFAGDERVTFDIPDGTDAWVPVYNTGHLLTHGDQVTGGAGIGGIWPPIQRLKARKAERVQKSDRSLDVLVMGHWHQLVQAAQNGVIVNGSLKGWDEYAATSNFRAERAQQAGWLVTPEHGVTVQFPIFCDDRPTEGW